MERAFPGEVLAPVLMQFHAPRAHQRHQVGLSLDPFDLAVRNAWHITGSFFDVSILEPRARLW